MKLPQSNLEYIFHPNSIAFAGVSRIGQAMLEIHLTSGFEGNLYPISRSMTEVLGLQCYTDIKEIPDQVDYVWATIPAQATPQFVQDCVTKGVKVVSFFTAGFSEKDEDGAKLEAEITEIARRGGMRILGPNCMGLYCPSTGLTFAHGLPQQSGSVGFICQSGGNSAYGVRAAVARGAYFSKAISYGNACDLNEYDLLEYLATDPETKIITAYIEGIKDRRRFFKLLREVTKLKPVIVLKGGHTAPGAATAFAHTGALPFTPKNWNSHMRQAGAIQVRSLDEMVDVVLPFIHMSPPRGRNVCVIGLGGGASVISADQCVRAGLSVPPLPEKIQQKIGESVLNPAGNILVNPVDPQFAHGGFFEIVRTVADWDGIDMLFLRLPHNITAYYRDPGRQALEMMISFANESSKPVAIILDHVATPEATQVFLDRQQHCGDSGVASFPSIERAANAMTKFIEYHQGKNESS
jgi:acetyltransferase